MSVMCEEEPQIEWGLKAKEFYGRVTGIHMMVICQLWVSWSP